MKLTMKTYQVERVESANRTAWEKEILYINFYELRALILRDEVFTDVSIEVAYPGEKTRIIHVLDAVEPRVKVEGPSGCFPSFLGPPETAGQGVTHRLSGVALLGVGLGKDAPFSGDGGVLTFAEGIIDMSGPAQPYCTCADTVNICLCFSVPEGCPNSAFDSFARLATLKAADYLARCTTGLTPTDEQTYSLSPVDPDLPRFAYVNQIQSQGFLCRTFLYGTPMEDSFTPTLLHPNELMDGALVSGNYRNFHKACTFSQQNNYVVRELYRRHGKDVNFVGQIISRGHFDDLPMKTRQGHYAAKIASLLGAQAVVLTMEAGGNAVIEYMLTVAALEQSGIIAVPIVHELSGPNGSDQPLVFVVPEAVSMVTGGGVDRMLEVPAVDRVIGGDTVLFPDGPSAGKPIDASSSFLALYFHLYGMYWQTKVCGATAVDY